MNMKAFLIATGDGTDDVNDIWYSKICVKYIIAYVLWCSSNDSERFILESLYYFAIRCAGASPDRERIEPNKV